MVWDVVKNPKKSKKFAELLTKFDTVLGLKIEKKETNKFSEIPKDIIDLAEQRKIARINKNWQESDRIRDLIIKKGYLIKDTKDGYEITNGVEK